MISEQEYEIALARAGELMQKDLEEGTPELNELDQLAKNIQTYEAIHWLPKLTIDNSSEQVRFIPNLEVGELEATILMEHGDKTVLLCQDRLTVAAKDGDIYRPYPETTSFDLLTLTEIRDFNDIEEPDYKPRGE